MVKLQSYVALALASVIVLGWGVRALAEDPKPASPGQPQPAAAAPAAPAGAPAAPAGGTAPAKAPAGDPNRIGPPAIEAPSGQPAVAPVPGPGATPNPNAKKPHFEPFIPPKDYAPPVTLIEQPKYDWGTVYKGEVVTHAFEVWNKGGSALVIQKIRPSCGCTLVNDAASDKVIQPNQKGSFELKIETSRLMTGQQSKYADVSTNDPKSPQTRVFIQGKIESLLKVEPESPKIETIRGKGQGTLEITLTKNAQGEVKLLGAKSQSGRLNVDMKEVQPGSIWKLHVQTNYGPKDTQSYFTETVQLDVQVGERRMPQDVSMTVIVKDRIDLDPRVISYRKADFDALKSKNQPATRTVRVRTLLPDPYKFKIVNTKIDDPDNFFTYKIEPVQDGREYRLVVTVEKLPTLGKDQRSMKGNITIQTDDPEMAEVSIRVLAFF
jgi:hypothetical protein